MFGCNHNLYSSQYVMGKSEALRANVLILLTSYGMRICSEFKLIDGSGGILLKSVHSSNLSSREHV